VERSQKQQLVATLHEDLADTVCVVVTHQTGLTVDEVTQLRRQMRGAGASYRVTKNRLAKRALEGTAFTSLAPLFTGPTAIAFSRDPVAAARMVMAFNEGLLTQARIQDDVSILREMVPGIFGLLGVKGSAVTAAAAI